MTRAQIIHTHALAHSFPKIRQRFLPSKSHNVSIKPILAEPQSLRRSRSLLKLAASCHGCSTQLYGFLMQKKDCLVIHAPSSWDTTLSSLSNDEWTHSIYNICFISSSVYSISAVGVWCCLSSCHPDFMSNFKFIVKMYAVKNLFRLNFSYFLFQFNSYFLWRWRFFFILIVFIFSILLRVCVQYARFWNVEEDDVELCAGS